jgi:signal transduction histidine kinase
VGIFFVCLALVLWIVSSESIYMHQLQLTLKSRDLQISQLMKSQQTHVDSSTKTDQSLATLHEGIERVSSALAHFVKGPAISILGSIQSLLLGEGKGAKVEKENILNQARSLNEISDQLLAFCGEKDESPVKTSISRLLRDYANEETAQLKKRNIKLNIHIPDIADFELRERQILAAIRAVWNNAIESMDKMANKEISLGLVDEGEFVKIILSDTGPGMDSETLQKCLNPFFTTKGKNHFGMGLSLAQGILQQQGGRLQVQSEKGQGTKVTMSIAKLIKQQVKSAQDSQSEPKTKSEVTPILLDMESTMLLGRLPPAPPSKISFENQFEDLKLTATPLTQSPDSPPDINVDVLLDELPEPAPHSVAPEKTSTIAMKDVAVDQPRSGKNIEKSTSRILHSRQMNRGIQDDNENLKNPEETLREWKTHTLVYDTTIRKGPHH